jgi:hypothetical protein
MTLLLKILMIALKVSAGTMAWKLELPTGFAPVG